MEIKNSTLRYFSLIWIAILAFIIPYTKPNWYEYGNIYSLIACGYFVLTLILPILVKPIFIIQTKIATLIGNVVSTLILGIVFYLVVTPIGMVSKMSGSDLLKKKLDKNSKTYWITREKQPGSLKNQF